MPKFKKGDKVKIPPPEIKGTYSSENLTTEETSAVRRAREHGLNYLIVIDPSIASRVAVNGSDTGYYHQSWFHENDLELYEEFPEKWFIERNKENAEIINKWFTEKTGLDWDLKDRWLNFPQTNPYAWESKNRIPKEYIEITFDQFKKQFMQETRKILSYKTKQALPDVKAGEIGTLIGDYWTFPSQGMWPTRRYSKDTVANSSDWFEPIYEDEFKVGDWVIGDEKLRSYSNSVWKEAFQIAKLEKDYLYNKAGNNNSPHRFRRATPEEIEKAQTLEIAGYKAERTLTGIKFGCQEFSLSELTTISRLISSTDLKGKLTIHGVQITNDMIAKLLNMSK